jgi:hypothetical protein
VGHGDAWIFVLETTRLASREKPYILNVELARFRLMKVVQKQEDWNLFDFPRAEKFGPKFREAQDLSRRRWGCCMNRPTPPCWRIGADDGHRSFPKSFGRFMLIC